MIAYKFFYVQSNGELQCGVMQNYIEPYDPKVITTRAEGCGPFAAFRNLHSAYFFQRSFAWSTATLFKVKIKESKEKCLWIDNDFYPFKALPPGTILADEFEILKEVKL